ncbi:alpha/beta fold hydrolase [Pseudoteredinibacter isoporae]|uniref:Proline iminopeptidase n=1 Tax=Pseudoteredinibacter isoporae TaxID=570281 RepID=A0A7X0N029_9GAMM|nr:alpha/beta hydrolase [Pseudoteredinibacter isoporae]MBB6523832.1 proline iminopeptidase [Pseudoteredinibacter isoporae]NHO89352.1 alpha/beta hydrolase [Pseudoteredinibacter isoporae]NIB22459.1 alpha/beta hydrolase [Pseudoteredinibacter isoporae]
MNDKLSLLALTLVLFLPMLSASPGAGANSDQLPKPYGQGSYIPSKFGKLYYEEEGAGTPVVMINGGPGASRTVFWGALDFLKPYNYKIVYFDETGVGRSTRNIPETFSPKITVQDIETLRKHLDVNKIVLAAHSYGGIPALQYAIQYPQNVEKLIMLSASADGISQQMNVDAAKYLRRTFFPQEWEALEKIRAKGVLSSEKEYSKPFYDRKMGNVSDWHDPKNRAKLRKYRSTDQRDRFNIEVYRDIAGNDPEVEITGTLKDIVVNKETLKSFNVPTLILNGRIDWKTTPQMAYRFYKMLPEGVGRLEFLEKTGHWTWAEEPDKFAEIVIRFLGSDSPPEI